MAGFFQSRRVDSHVRHSGRGRYSIQREHTPRSHRAHAELAPLRLIHGARKTGPATARLVEILLQNRPHPQAKIERYHRTLKNVVLLQNYWMPGDLERENEGLAQHYNHERVRESLGNLTPADVHFGRAREIRTARGKLKQQTLRRRQRINRSLPMKPEEKILPVLYRESLS